MVKIPFIVKYILKCVKEENNVNLESYTNDVLKRDYIVFKSENEFINFFKDYYADFFSKCTYGDIKTLSEYTGYNYKFINAILRGNWNYNEHGYCDDKVRERWRNCADEIKEVFKKAPDCLSGDIKVYRGVSISSFKDYGVTSLDDLKDLVGTYYYDLGFTSTSLLRNKSFFDREFDYHNDCNIEIEYMIPQECSDEIPVINEDMSYSVSQCEFVINSDSLSKIVDVQVDREANKAYIKAILIPTKVWNKRHEKDNSIKK